MEEVKFRKWLIEQDISKKLQSDFISRLKRIERELNFCDLDEEFKRDQFKELLLYFESNGNNAKMREIKNVDLPIGKSTMSTFKYSLKKYKAFKIDTTSDVTE